MGPHGSVQFIDLSPAIPSTIIRLASSADSEEKHGPASDIDTAAVDSLKVLDFKRPIREADIL